MELDSGVIWKTMHLSIQPATLMGASFVDAWEMGAVVSEHPNLVLVCPIICTLTQWDIE